METILEQLADMLREQQEALQREQQLMQRMLATFQQPGLDPEQEIHDPS